MRVGVDWLASHIILIVTYAHHGYINPGCFVTYVKRVKQCLSGQVFFVIYFVEFLVSEDYLYDKRIKRNKLLKCQMSAALYVLTFNHYQHCWRRKRLTKATRIILIMTKANREFMYRARRGFITSHSKLRGRPPTIFAFAKHFWPKALFQAAICDQLTEFVRQLGHVTNM